MLTLVAMSPIYESTTDRIVRLEALLADLRRLQDEQLVNNQNGLAETEAAIARIEAELTQSRSELRQ